MIDVKVLRSDPDRVRASQRARGESASLVDDLLAADEARRNAIARYEELRAEQKNLGKQVAQGEWEERDGAARRTKELADLVKKADAARARSAVASTQMLKRRQSGLLTTFRSAARTTTRCWRRTARRVTSTPRASSPKIISNSDSCWVRSTSSAAPRCPAAASTT